MNEATEVDKARTKHFAEYIAFKPKAEAAQERSLEI